MKKTVDKIPFYRSGWNKILYCIRGLPANKTLENLHSLVPKHFREFYLPYNPLIQ
jgi:hypothetical protein